MDARGLLDIALREHQARNFARAEALYRSILSREANDANALHLLGVLLHQTGRDGEAVELLRRSVAIAPGVAHFHSNLAGVLGKLDRVGEALVHLREAIHLCPQLPETHNNLGVALESLGRYDEAVAAYSEALRLRPEYAECHNNLGNALRKQLRFEEAVREHRIAIGISPDYAEAHSSLSTTYEELGRLEESIASRRRAVALRPESPQDHSSLLFALNYDPQLTPREVFLEHVRWGERHAQRHYPDPAQRYENNRDPDRRLRIGYVSADFRAHPVSRFFEPILRHHDRSRFEVFCYSGVVRPDAVTLQLRQYEAHWRDVRALSDDALAELIRRDRIDILVDLSGHMVGNRLLVFARKPAPVQVSYLGYPNTTGVRTIDYRITDSRHDPEGQNDALHVEKLLRIGDCCWCYEPDADAPPVNELPCLGGKPFTFCCLNKPIKVTPQMVRLWSQILNAVPGSRLMVLRPGSLQAVYDFFERNGIPHARLLPCERVSHAQYLLQYHQADLALDTFPYNGHTTTCDALWMGVPSVTLAGTTHVSRAGLSVLSAVRLQELVCPSPEAYVDTSVSLATNPAFLATVRADLRQRMQSFVRADGCGFLARLEIAYREAWTQYSRRRYGYFERMLD